MKFQFDSVQLSPPLLVSCRQTLHGTPGGISGNLQQFQNRNQQLTLSGPVCDFLYALSYPDSRFQIPDYCVVACLLFIPLEALYHFSPMRSLQDIKTDMNQMMNVRAAGPEGSLMGISGIGQSILLTTQLSYCISDC